VNANVLRRESILNDQLLAVSVLVARRGRDAVGDFHRAPAVGCVLGQRFVELDQQLFGDRDLIDLV
jgi:hypothetical protein